MNVSPALPIDAAAKSAAVLLGAFVLTSFLRRNSAAVRHLVWTMAAALALLLPVGSILLPTYTVALPQAWSARTASPHDVPADTRVEPAPAPGSQAAGTTPAPTAPVPVGIPASPPAHAPIRVYDLLPVVWLAGAACVSAYWLIGFVAVFRLCRTVPAVDAGPLYDLLRETQSRLCLRRTVRLRVGPAVRMPITCGTLRPQLFLPSSAETWPEDQLRSTLMHELAHAKRLDCAAQSLMNWACALYWFNPLVWLASVHLRAERELACDDLVLNHGAAPASYAEHLLAVARSFRAQAFPHPTAIAMARPSGLRQRVADVLNAGVNRRMLSPRLILTAALLTSMALVSLSCIRVEMSVTPPAEAVVTTSPNGHVVRITTATTRPTTMPRTVFFTKHDPSAPAFPTLVTVLDDSTGKPVEGVEIVYDSIPQDGRALTDAHGQARIVFQGSRIPCMTLARAGYIGKLFRWSLRTETGQTGGPPSDLTVRLEPASSIGGKVVDDAGRPIAGANVEIYVNGSATRNGPEFVENPWINRAVTTAADGTWHFDRIPPHAKSIKVAAWDYHHLDGGYFFLKEYAPQSALRDKTAVLTLPRGVTVTGTVVDPFFGKPIPHAKVAFGTEPSASNTIPPMTTDAQGSFTVGVQPGTKLVLTVSAPGYRPQVQQQVVNDQPVSLEFNLSPTHVQ